MLVVPDSIEPVVGWKGLNLKDGILYSPSYSFEWRPGAPAEAFCHSAHKIIRTWSAKVLKPEEFPRIGSNYPQSEMRYGTATDNWVYMVTTYHTPLNVEHVFVTYDSEDRPVPPFDPESLKWELSAELNHGAPPAKRCSCGLYMATEPTFSYGPIHVELYGWGTTIPGTQGFKCQYAYPKRIYVPDNHSVAMKKLEVYGVPVYSMEYLGKPDPEPQKKTTLTIPSWLKSKKNS